MVRVNLIDPKYLADQHLVAEYAEILMLLAYVKRYQEVKYMPESYCLGKGHQVFFKDKLKYLKKRHEIVKKEMRKRGFAPKQSVNLKGFKRSLINDWKPCNKDKEIIKKRLMQKLKFRPKFYRYYGEKKSLKFFIEMTKKA